MKVGLKGMLATSAAAAALFAGAQVALADGMPAVGFESGWDWDSVNDHFLAAGTHSHWNRDVVGVELFAGYQHQFGPVVLGVELNIIGNEFDETDRMYPTGNNGNCPNTSFTCVGRITNEFTIGPRLGYALGKFMPYATGGAIR